MSRISPGGLAVAAAAVLGSACSEAGPRLLDAPVLAATPELRIGSVDDSATALTRVTALAVDDDGRIYTAHPQDVAILVHAADGRRLRQWGRQGEGPGEFGGLGGIVLVRDTLWAYDYRQYRFTAFAPDGRLLRTVTVPIELGGPDRTSSPPRPAGMLPDGRIFGSPPAWSREVASGNLPESPVLLMDTTGAAGDTLYSRPNSIWAVRDPKSSRGFGSYRQQPFDDIDLYATSPMAPEYVRVQRAVGAGGGAVPTFRVARVTFDGDTLWDRAYPYEPVPIDPAIPDSLVDGFAAGLNQAGFPGAPTPARAAELARAALYVPAHYPPVTRAVVGRDGTIWLRREAADPQSAEWLVLDSDGEPIGRVTLPARTTVAVAERDRFWGWELDDLDVPYVVRYAVDRGASR